MSNRELTNKLAAIQARADAATPGPWKGRSQTNAMTGETRYHIDSIDAACDWIGEVSDCTNRSFIAAARTDVPALLAVIGKLIEQRNQFADTLAEQNDVTYNPREEDASILTILKEANHG